MTPQTDGSSIQPASGGRELAGDLPCVVCGYNLRGLSIRSMCPECGSGVRATILAIVDPEASELKPIALPGLISAGTVMWVAGAFGAALVSWVPHAADLLRFFGSPVERPNVILAIHLGLLASALGSLALIRPHAGIPWLWSFMSFLGTLLYAPLAYALYQYHLAAGSLGPKYLSEWTPSERMTTWFCAAAGIMALMILLQRPMAKLLVSRSRVMRTGWVDRQMLWAMAGACVLMAAGGGLGHLVGNSIGNSGGVLTLTGGIARIAGISFIGVGSFLLTIGLLGMLIDAIRVSQAIRAPGVSAKQLIREGHTTRTPKTSKFTSWLDGQNR